MIKRVLSQIVRELIMCILKMVPVSQAPSAPSPLWYLLPHLLVKQHPYFLLGSTILPSSSSAWFGGIVPRPCLKQRSPQHSG